MPRPPLDAIRTNIYCWAEPGQRQHVLDEACWCEPGITKTIGPAGEDRHTNRTVWREHLVIDHGAGLQPAVAAALAADNGIDLFPCQPPVVPLTGDGSVVG